MSKVKNAVPSFAGIFLSVLRDALVLQLSTDELKELVGQTSCQNSSGQKYSFAVQSILEMGRAWDDQAIYQQFELDWSALGPIGFISERASNLLDQLGQGWANGQISIATEHFISRILEKFLIEKWTLKNAKNGNRKLLLSSLDGEGHAFGLHFCAVATVVSGAKVVFLGPSTPEADIVSAAQSSECFGVCLSVSRHYDSNLAVKKIRYIRKHLPPTIHLIVGGAGAPVGIQGVLAMTGCQALYDWLSSEKGSP